MSRPCKSGQRNSRKSLIGIIEGKRKIDRPRKNMNRCCWQGCEREIPEGQEWKSFVINKQGRASLQEDEFPLQALSP